MQLPPNIDKPLEGLREGALDLAAGLFVSLPRGYHRAPLFRDDYLSVTRPGLVEDLSLETFLKLDHAMIATGGTPGGPVDDALEKLGLSRRVRLRLPHFLAAPILVSQNDLILTLPGRVAQTLSELIPLQVWKPPVELDGFQIDMVWHQRSHHDPAHRWIRQQAALVAADMSSD